MCASGSSYILRVKQGQSSTLIPCQCQYEDATVQIVFLYYISICLMYNKVGHVTAFIFTLLQTI